MTEELLPGGRATPGVVRIGDTVRRPAKTNSEFVQELLNYLHSKGYPWSPRFLGIDEKGREILSYIDGAIPPPKFQWPEKSLVRVVEMLRALHDATAGTRLAGHSDCVCHNDFTPWNIILSEGLPVGIIDFEAAAPGERGKELAYLAWTFLWIGTVNPLRTQVANIHLIYKTYCPSKKGTFTDATLRLMDESLNRRKALESSARTEHELQIATRLVAEMEEEIKWLRDNQNEFVGL
jgi:hypothetical protein